MRLASLRYSRIALAVVSGALQASACTSPGAESGTDAAGSSAKARYQTGLVNASQDAGKPVEGGTLTIAAYTEARSLDPTKTISTGASGGIALAAVYDTLMRFNPAGTDAKKQQVMANIERLWNKAVPGVSMAPRPVFTAWQDNVHGIVPTTSTMLLLGGAWKGA